MADVFLSYAREDRAAAARLAKSIEAEGYSVWWDHALKPHQDMTAVIDAELERAACVVVLWSQAARGSAWVRSEASTGLERGKLIQVRLDDVRPPRPFDQFQIADLSDWRGEPEHADRWALSQSVSELVGRAPTRTAPAPAYRVRARKKPAFSMPSLGALLPGAALIAAVAGVFLYLDDKVIIINEDGVMILNEASVARIAPEVQDMLQDNQDLF